MNKNKKGLMWYLSIIRDIWAMEFAFVLFIIGVAVFFVYIIINDSNSIGSMVFGFLVLIYSCYGAYIGLYSFFYLIKYYITNEKEKRTKTLRKKFIINEGQKVKIMSSDKNSMFKISCYKDDDGKLRICFK